METDERYSMDTKNRVVIFGASGAIGTALVNWFSDRKWEVTAVARSLPKITGETAPGIQWLVWDPFVGRDNMLSQRGLPFDAAVWAQGHNFNDNIHNFNALAHEEMYRANVVYILKTLNSLLSAEMLAVPARLCVISSIWQNIARQNKLSYTVTKSALQGLIQSLVTDLGPDGHLVNAVLPGALDTPMTRANLSDEQVRRLEAMTPIGKLPALEDVCNLVGFLCSPENTGITGQFIAADRGFSYARIF